MFRTLSTIAVAFLLFSRIGASQSLLFKTIDFPATGILGQAATAIDDRGRIIGSYQLNSSATLHGFVLENDSFETLDVSPLGGTLRGINKHGEISGFLSDQNGLHAFRYFSGITTVIDVPGANLTEGTGLNDKGQIVGDYRDPTNSNIFHGFVYENGYFITLDFPGASATAPSSINNRGQIVGFFLNASGFHGFLFDSGLYTSIDMPGALFTNPLSINDHGVIVGSYSNGFTNHGFIYRDGTFTTIDFPEAALTEVWGINNKGTIVGRYVDTSAVNHNFVGTPVLEISEQSGYSQSGMVGLIRRPRGAKQMDCTSSEC